jgi:hypothetical protein
MIAASKATLSGASWFLDTSVNYLTTTKGFKTGVTKAPGNLVYLKNAFYTDAEMIPNEKEFVKVLKLTRRLIGVSELVRNAHSLKDRSSSLYNLYPGRQIFQVTVRTFRNRLSDTTVTHWKKALDIGYDLAHLFIQFPNESRNAFWETTVDVGFGVVDLINPFKDTTDLCRKFRWSSLTKQDAIYKNIADLGSLASMIGHGRKTVKNVIQAFLTYKQCKYAECISKCISAGKNGAHVGLGLIAILESRFEVSLPKEYEHKIKSVLAATTTYGSIIGYYHSAYFGLKSKR